MYAFCTTAPGVQCTAGLAGATRVAHTVPGQILILGPDRKLAQTISDATPQHGSALAAASGGGLVTEDAASHVMSLASLEASRAAGRRITRIDGAAVTRRAARTCVQLTP